MVTPYPRRDLLKLIGVREFSLEASFQDPCQSFILPEASTIYRIIIIIANVTMVTVAMATKDSQSGNFEVLHHIYQAEVGVA